MKNTKEKLSKKLDHNLQFKALFSQLQENMNAEYQAHYHYLGLSNYFDDLDYDGFAAFYLEQSDEEREHAHKYRIFLLELDQIPLFKKLEDAKTTFKSPLAGLEAALAYEEAITEKTHSLLKTAEALKHYPTIEFLDQFVNDQVKEIDEARSLVARAKQLPNNQAIFFIDQELRPS